MGPVRTFTTNHPAPTPSQVTAKPGDGDIVTTLTPKFTADTVVDSDSSVPVKYMFRIATGTDGRAGTVITSAWLDAPTSGQLEWTPPAGSLQDGGSYTWVVVTDDGVDNDAPPAWVNKMTVNLRLGSSGPSPFDTAGPVSVNLANGNMTFGFSSPTVQTVGGPMGMSFTYNSQQQPTVNRGLTATYYSALAPGQTSTTTFDITGKPSLLVRTDSVVNFNWGLDSPAPAVPKDYFMARWEGFITVPSGGNYRFGVARDDGVKVTIGSATTIDQWNTAAVGLTWAPQPTTMTTAPTQFQMDYYEAGGGASTQLWVRDPSGKEFIVPADWFSKKTQILPTGWSSSTPVAGGYNVYASAQVSDASITLTDTSGSVHIYPKVTTPAGSTGGYTAPKGEYGVLALDSNGLVTLTDESGTVTAFNAAGKVASVTSTADAMKPATPIVQYRTNGAPDRISDPLSVNVGSNPTTYAREVRFVYWPDTAASLGLSGETSTTSGSGCAVPSDWQTANGTPKDGMLCRIIYPGHVAGAKDTTLILYNGNGQMARIVNPGDSTVGTPTTDFGYSAAGYLDRIRDPQVNDWVGTQDPSTIFSNYAIRTGIVYDSTGKVTAVRLPAPDGLTVADRPEKTYVYDTVNRITTVDVTGQTVPSGTHARTVTYTESWQMTSDTSPLGVTSSVAWSTKDQVLSTTDSLGRMTTTIYDPKTDRPTDSYGPAPASCFNLTTRVPAGTCDVKPAHSITTYDSLQGLHVAYYANPKLSGAPKRFSFGLIGVTGGALNMDWGSNAADATITPASDRVLPADGWSLRATGLITFPQTGNYTIKTNADDGTRVWLDDVLVVNNWVDQAPNEAGSYQFAVVAGDQRRIRVEYYDASLTASLILKWVTPSGGAAVVIPGSALKPDYGLVSQTKTEDAAPQGYDTLNANVPNIVTDFDYGDSPWLGTPALTKLDPSGLNLITQNRYEAPGTSGWLRRTSRQLPAAYQNLDGAYDANKDTTYTYYGDKQTLGESSTAITAPICGVALSTPQSGLLRKITPPLPSAQSGVALNAAVRTWFVYDILGRVVGSTHDSSLATNVWTCTTYDARGRVTAVSYPAYGGYPARTVNYSYGVNTTGLTASVSEDTNPSVAGPDADTTLTTTTDVLGRVRTSTDVWLTETTSTYERLTGRLTSVSVKPAGSGVTPTVTAYAYDADGKVDTVKIDGTVYADATYASNQLLKSITYLNGTSLTSIQQNAAGATTSMTWAFPTATQAAGVMPAKTVTTGFEAGLDSWAASSGTAATGTPAHTGSASAALEQTSSSPAVLSRTLTGLSPGRSYIVEAWIATTDTSATTVSTSLNVAGITEPTPATVTAAPAVGTAVVWAKASYTFTATAASHTVQVTATAPTGNASIVVDDITVGLTVDVRDSVVRSQTGRILQNTLTDGATTETSTYAYDAAGRLVKALIPRHELTYTFANTSTCGANTSAGRDGNRTAFEDKKDGSVVTTVNYCYDWADRLTATTSTGVRCVSGD